jgi:Stigma-specific protein, Stig1
MERLDELSKSLAVSVSRRDSLRTIGAVLAGVVLSPLLVGTAWAARPDRCTAFCRSCSTKKKRNQSVSACQACNGNTNRLCGSCGAYVCCATGTACCNGTCTSLNSDPHNCGACGYVCPASAPICDEGTCSGCPTGSTNCGGACIDTTWDALNCGGCGIQCSGLEYCSWGQCYGVCAGCE